MGAEGRHSGAKALFSHQQCETHLVTSAIGRQRRSEALQRHHPSIGNKSTVRECLSFVNSALRPMPASHERESHHSISTGGRDTVSSARGAQNKAWKFKGSQVWPGARGQFAQHTRRAESRLRGIYSSRKRDENKRGMKGRSTEKEQKATRQETAALRPFKVPTESTHGGCLSTLKLVK